MNSHTVMKTPHGRIVTNPPVARLLFDDTRFAVVWLVLRVLVGLDWLTAGWTKLNDPAWMQTGEALKGFWTNALKVSDTGKPVITYGWYSSFIKALLDSGSYTWVAKLVAFGE